MKPVINVIFGCSALRNTISLNDDGTVQKCGFVVAKLVLVMVIASSTAKMPKSPLAAQMSTLDKENMITEML